MTKTYVLAALLTTGMAAGGSAQTVNINCGGVAMTTSDGTVWSADQYYVDGELVYTGSSIAATGAQDYYLYRSGRAGLYTDFSYSIPLSNGSYTLTLRFAEVQFSAAGQRVFNVAVNGSAVLSNFDILANAAPFTPVARQFPVNVTNGSLQIAFTGVVNRGLVNAIQVAPAGGGSTGTGTGTSTGTGTGTGTGAGTGTGTQTGTGTGAGTQTGTSTGTGTGGSGVTLPPTGGNNWYVSTSGSRSGNGSQSSPWDIVTALAQPASVKPGDTIWIMAGTYGDGTVNTIIQSKLVGTPTSPIIVRAYPGQRATINNWLQVGCCDQANDPANGSYTWFWGLEFASYSTDRSSGTSGPPEWAAMSNHDGADTWGDGTKFINCIFHDTAGGISVWDTNNSELNGNVIYNVGGYGTDRGHGHLLYLQNLAPSVLTVNDNIGFNNFDEGVQAYGSSGAYVQNMIFTGNIIFNAGLLYGNLVDNFTIGDGDGGPNNITLNSNYTYDTPSRNLGQNEIGYLWSPIGGTASVTNNYFIGGYQAVDVERWNNVTFQNNTMYAAGGSQESWLIYNPGQNPAGYTYGNNTYYGSDQFWIFPTCSSWPCPGYTVDTPSQWQAAGLDRNSTFNSNAPTGVWTFVRPNQYEAGRANIVIYNWPLESSVSVDLSKSGINVGDQFQIRDAENWYNGAVVSGTYTGSPVSIPMSGLAVAQPVGSVPYQPSHTAPQFGAFVLLSGTALTNTY